MAAPLLQVLALGLVQAAARHTCLLKGNDIVQGLLLRIRVRPLLPKHRVGLAGARLPVGQNGAMVPLSATDVGRGGGVEVGHPGSLQVRQQFIGGAPCAVRKVGYFGPVFPRWPR